MVEVRRDSDILGKRPGDHSNTAVRFALKRMRSSQSFARKCGLSYSWHFLVALCWATIPNITSSSLDMVWSTDAMDAVFLIVIAVEGPIVGLGGSYTVAIASGQDFGITLNY